MQNKLILIGQENNIECVWEPECDVILGSVNIEIKPDAEEGRIRDGCQHRNKINPNDLKQMDFDYIVIVDHRIVHWVYNEIPKLGISMGKIVTYEYYDVNLRGRSFYSLDCEKEILSYITQLNPKKILDVDLFFANGSQFTNNEICPNGERIYGLNVDGKKRLWPIYNNLYDEIYESPNDFLFSMFDVAVLTEYRELNEIVEKVKELKFCARYIMIRFTANSEALKMMDTHSLLSRMVQQWKPCINGAIGILNTNIQENINIFVCMHKLYVLPILDDSYYPIHGGKKISENFGVPGDDVGISISELNPVLNELTVLYWMWKNSSANIVGLAHYRRYFLMPVYDNEGSKVHILNKEDIKEIFRDYDIILGAKHLYEFPYGNGLNILWNLNADLYEKSLAVVRKWLAVRQPQYIEAFDFVVGHHGFYSCNMFVTRKKILDAYAEWLFSFLLDAVGEFDYSGLSGNDKRIMGYWGEILINVWLVKQNLHIKELTIGLC